MNKVIKKKKVINLNSSMVSEEYSVWSKENSGVVFVVVLLSLH